MDCRKSENDKPRVKFAGAAQRFYVVFWVVFLRLCILLRWWGLTFAAHVLWAFCVERLRDVLNAGQ